MPATGSFGPTVTTFIDELLAEQPPLASMLGAPGHDDEVGDFTADRFAARDRRAHDWQHTFGEYGDDVLDAEERIDRDLILSSLAGQVLLEPSPAYRRDPSAYTEPLVAGVHMLFLHRLRPDAELVADACARLRQGPAVIEAAIGNLDPDLAPRLLVERGGAQAAGALRYIRDTVPTLVCDPELSARLAAAGADTVVALDRFVQWLDGLAERAAGDWRLGEPTYSALLAKRELLDFDATELNRRGEAAYRELAEAGDAVAAGIPDAPGGWRDTMEWLNTDHPPTLEAMRAEYAAATARAREFLVEHDMVPFADGERCEVVPGPAFLRPVLAVASYGAPPALTASRVGHFYVPFTPEDASAEQVGARLQTNSRASIPTIAAHETYPGHHWHLSWLAAQHRPIRKIVSTPYFAEGWALYAERCMAERGYFTEPAHELAHLDSRIFRAARIVVDTGLHAGEMSVQDAVEFMCTRASLSRETAQTEVQRYCAWPTQAASYLTGALEVERIRDRWRAANPGAPDKDFHAVLAGSGILPLGLAARAVLG